MRFRDHKPEVLNRARIAVAAWRERYPEGTYEQVVVALGPDFPAGYGPVLRSVLFTVDRQQARQVTGVIPRPGNAGGQ